MIAEFYNAYDFGLKKNTTRYILIKKFYDASDFQRKYFFKKHDSEEKCLSKKQDF